MNTLITLATYKKPATAYFLKNKLEHENIDCYFSFNSAVDLGADEISVQVKDLDVERSIQVMMQIKEEYGVDIEKANPGTITQRILVPTGFSKDSANACRFAIHLAEKIHAEIKLLHVYENPVTSLNIAETATYLEYINTVVKEAENNAKTEIMTFTDEMNAYIKSNKFKNVKIHSCIVKGNTVERIRKISDNYDPDVIVLATKGKTDDPNSILSKIAIEMVNGLETPLFAIPGKISPAIFDEANILYATDFNERDHNSLENLLKITDALKKKITCIHVDTEHSAAKEERMDELNVMFNEDYKEHHIVCQLIEHEDVILGIKNFVDQSDINLLSFTVRKKGIFEKLFKPNLFKRILQEAKLPILIFPS